MVHVKGEIVSCTFFLISKTVNSTELHNEKVKYFWTAYFAKQIDSLKLSNPFSTV